MAGSNQNSTKQAAGSSTASPEDAGGTGSTGASQTGFENQTGDAGKPTDTNASKSVGADNPNQGTGAGSTSDGTDAQGVASRNAEEARKAGEPTAAATVGASVTAQTPGRLPSESGGYSPAPHPDSGNADSDKVPYTQAVQRLVHPNDTHPIANALGEIANIPPGSRPLMIDPASGLGVQPPQTVEHDEKAAEAEREPDPVA